MADGGATAVRRIGRVAAWIAVSVLLTLPAGCKEQPKSQPPPPPKVTVARPVRQAVTDNLDLTGNTQAIYTVQLVARVVGYLEKVLFQDGQRVKKGQPLFVIQQNTYEDNLRQAEASILQFRAQLQYAESQLTRFSNLIQEKAAAQADVDNWTFQRDSATANLRSAQAQRDLAKLNLDYTLVAAPFDGRMDRRLVDPGNLVGTQGSTVLANINQVDPIYVYFNISDLDLARLLKSTGGIPGPGAAKKWPVYAGLPSEDGYPHQGHLDFAAISLTTTTGTLLMRHPAQRGREDPVGPLRPGAGAARAADDAPGPRGRHRARPAGRVRVCGQRQERGGAPQRHDRLRGGEPAGHRQRPHRRGVGDRQRSPEGRAGTAGHARA
jgi:RND family efflux transporter, MFP subunit